MKVGAVIAVTVTMVGMEPRAASACSLFAYNDVFLSSGTDVVSPTVAVTAATVWRGDGSCEGTGFVELTVAGADDQTAADQLAYQVRVVRSDGTLFPGLPATPFTQLGSELSLHFGDHGQPIDLTLHVSAVDRNGNVSTPVTVDVVDPGDDGDDGAGCAVSGGASAGWLAALGLVPLARRRRRR